MKKNTMVGIGILVVATVMLAISLYGSNQRNSQLAALYIAMEDEYLALSVEVGELRDENDMMRSQHLDGQVDAMTALGAMTKIVLDTYRQEHDVAALCASAWHVFIKEHAIWFPRIEGSDSYADYLEALDVLEEMELITITKDGQGGYSSVSMADDITAFSFDNLDFDNKAVTVTLDPDGTAWVSGDYIPADNN